MPAFVSICLGSVPSTIKVAIGCYVAVEVAFYVAFTYWLVPKSNRLQRYTRAAAYRDYPSLQDRHRLLLRILQRLERRRPGELRSVVETFLLQWFVRGQQVDHDDDGAFSGFSRPEDGATSRARRQEDYLSSSNNASWASSTVSTSPPSVVAESEDGSSVDSGSNHPTTTDANFSSESPTPCFSSGEHVLGSLSQRTSGSLSPPLSQPEPWTLEGLDADHVNDLFSWAFFGTSMPDLEREGDKKEAEQVRSELRKMHSVIREHVGLRFDDGQVRSKSQPGGGAVPMSYRARQMTLEPVNALHRPLLAYLGIAILQRCANLVLRCLGFRRVVSSSTGLVGWYRSSRTPSEIPRRPPLLFFHGIAPAGHVFYLPMVLRGLSTGSNQGRGVYMFENPHIACSLSNLLFDQGAALTEPETVRGVQEILVATLGREAASSTPLSLVGHSFGSVPLTWMLHSHFRPRIASMLLIDPVTILLSEPDVMINFLYSTDVSKIRMLASSELGIQVYLRRHFAWYNAELWLQDVPSHVALAVALSEHDEILNAPKVRDELEHHGVSHLYWRHVGHARCVTSPAKWRQLRELMDAATTVQQPDGSTTTAQRKKDE